MPTKTPGPDRERGSRSGLATLPARIGLRPPPRLHPGRWAILRRPFAWLALLGPGLVAANAGNDAGGVATYSVAGASYGYDLIWVMIVVTVSLMVVQEMAARMGAATGKGLSDLVRERFGVGWSVFAMATLFFANFALVISEFAAIAAASELMGIPRLLAVPISAALIWALVLRGSYRRVERVFLAFTFVFLAYPVLVFTSPPDWSAVLHHAVAPHVRLSFSYLYIAMATVGTSITPYMQLFLQSAVAEKWHARNDRPRYRADVYLGSAFADAIAVFIIIATGATLFTHGIAVQSASDAARALQPLVGRYAEIAFAIGLYGASVLAAAVLPLATAYAVSEAFGFEKGMGYKFREAPVFLGLFTGILGVGALVAIIPGLPLIPVIVLAQVINGALVPVILLFMLKLVNDPQVMGQHVNGKVANAVAWATTVLVGGLSVLLIGVAVGQWTGLVPAS